MSSACVREPLGPSLAPSLLELTGMGDVDSLRPARWLRWRRPDRTRTHGAGLLVHGRLVMAAAKRLAVVVVPERKDAG